jgi:hypothetical protein
MLSKYGVARHVYLPITKRSVVDMAVGADWTPVAGDVTISKDGGAAANVTNLPVALVMGNSAVWDFSLTATEMSAAQVTVTWADAATKVIEDDSISIETYGNASAQHAMDFGTATIAVTDKTGFSLSNAGIDSVLDRAAGVETNYTLRQAMRLLLAVCAGKVSGAGGATITFRDVNDTKNRVVASVSAGNRTAVTTDVT